MTPIQRLNLSTIETSSQKTGNPASRSCTDFLNLPGKTRKGAITLEYVGKRPVVLSVAPSILERHKMICWPGHD